MQAGLSGKGPSGSGLSGKGPSGSGLSGKGPSGQILTVYPMPVDWNTGDANQVDSQLPHICQAVTLTVAPLAPCGHRQGIAFGLAHLRSAYRGGALGAICSAALQAEFSLGNDDQGAARHRPSRRHGTGPASHGPHCAAPAYRAHPPARSGERRAKQTAALLTERFDSIRPLESFG